MLIFWGVFYQPPPGELSPDFDRTKHQRKYRLFVACRMRTTSPVRSLEEPWKNSLPEDHGSQWVSSSRLKEDGWFLLLLLLLLFFSQIFVVDVLFSPNSQTLVGPWCPWVFWQCIDQGLLVGSDLWWCVWTWDAASLYQVILMTLQVNSA